MLSKRTVFVVGAGASFELGLPLGKDLRGKIANLLNITYEDGWSQSTGDRQINEILLELARETGRRGISDLLQKCWLLRDALPGAISIDNLLDAHRSDPEIALIGKLAITKAILDAERSSALSPHKNGNGRFNLHNVSGTWLIPLFQILSENLAKEHVSDIFGNCTFIVFNYDRCLEYFLPRALSLYYGIDESLASSIMESANIIHPYGRVGEFGRGKSLSTAAFGAKDFDLRKIAEGIKTFSEGLQFENHADEIKRSITASDQIIFLGFAFHPLNMDIMSVDDPSSVSQIFGTTVGLSDAAVRSVKGGIYQMVKKTPPPVKEGLKSALALREINLENRGASDFLLAHFRGLAA
jgi:hypothetical protein